MKRLFTLLMVLLIASAGYSQVKQVSRNDSKKNVATVQQFNGFETLKFVENAPTMTRSDGELDYTIYDWQSNDGPVPGHMSGLTEKSTSLTPMPVTPVSPHAEHQLAPMTLSTMCGQATVQE